MRRKEEKGSVTLFVLISCMFMVVILLIVNIGVMNKNRSQEKNLEEIAKQYNQNETDLDNIYEEKVEDEGYIKKAEVEEIINTKIEDVKKDMYYMPGDSITKQFRGAGYVTTGGTAFSFTISVGKLIDKEVKSITVEGISNIVIRQNDNYILGQAVGNTTTGFSVEVPFYENDTGNIEIYVTVPTKNAKTINNDAVGITIVGLKLKFN